MPTTVTMSSKNQVVIPREAREMMHLSPGGQLLVLCDANRIVMIPKPADFVAKTAGLHKEIWEGVDTENYIREERESWNP